jgi:hypothetical protein
LKKDDDVSEVPQTKSAVKLPAQSLGPIMISTDLLFETESTSDESDGEGKEIPYLLSTLDINQRNLVEDEKGIHERTNSPINSTTFSEAPWEPTKFMMELFELLATQGNVQTVVFLSLTLSNVLDLSTIKLEMYFNSYLEQLYQLKLWPEATTIIKHCNIQSISTLNQEFTTICTSCNNCSTAVPYNTGTLKSYCEKCKQDLFRCSFW